MLIVFCRRYVADETLTLVGLGFYIPAASAQDDYRIVKCSFCRKSFTFGSRFAESYSTVECRISKLLWRHSVLRKCPTAIGLKSDNRALDINVINHYLYNHFGSAIPNAGVTLSSIPHETLHYSDPLQSANQRSTIEVESQQDFEGEYLMTTIESMGNSSTNVELEIRTDIPDRDDERYYHYRAEFEVEPFSDFNVLEDSENLNLDCDLPRLEMLDYMIGMEPARKDMLQLEKREHTFIDLCWSARVHFTNPSFDKSAEAGFYYTGETDCVRCFWCSLGLNCWGPGDDPWREHARFSPRCPWLLRCRGHYFVRKVILQSVTPAAVEQDKLLILRSWDDIHGMLDFDIYLQNSSLFDLIAFFALNIAAFVYLL